MGSKTNMIAVFIRRGKSGHTNRHTREKEAEIEGMPRMAGNHQNPEEAWKDSTLEPQTLTLTHQDLDLKLLDSST